MALTTVDFKTSYPEFDTVENAVVDALLLKSSDYVSDTILGTKLETGIFLLVAHELTLLERTNPKKAFKIVTSRSGLGHSVSMQNLAKNHREAYLSLSFYGQQFLAIVSPLKAGAYILD